MKKQEFVQADSALWVQKKEKEGKNARCAARRISSQPTKKEEEIRRLRARKRRKQRKRLVKHQRRPEVWQQVCSLRRRVNFRRSRT